MKQNRILTSSGDWRSVLTAVGVLALAGTVSADNLKLNHEFNEPGNILIADQFNNRVVEVSPNGNIVWSFGLGPNIFSPKSIIGVNDAQRVGSFTLMAGTGTPAGVIPQAPDGVPDNHNFRTLIVDANGHLQMVFPTSGDLSDEIVGEIIKAAKATNQPVPQNQNQ